MATFTTKADGNWSASGQTTWNEAGVPGDGDTVTLSHNVTVDTNTTVGSDPGTGGTAAVAFSASVTGKTLTVATGITLTLKGNLVQTASNLGTSTVTLQAGAQLVFLPGSGQQYIWTHAQYSHIICSGTSGAHCVIKTDLSSGGLAAYTTTSASRWEGLTSSDYLDVIDMGVSNQWGIKTSLLNTGLASASVKRTTFTRSSYTATDGGGTWNGSFLLEDVICSDGVVNSLTGISTAYATQFTNTPTGADSRIINRCDFDKLLRLITHKYVYVTNCILRAGHSNGPNPVVPDKTYWANNLVLFDSGNGASQVNLAGSMEDCYYALSDTSNPHFCGLPGSTHTIEDCIFEAYNATAANGDVLSCSSNAQPTITGCLVLPNAVGSCSGKLLGTLTATGVVATVDHNTFCATAGEGGLVQIGENDPASDAGCLASCQSNIVWSATDSTNVVAIRETSTTPATDAVTITGHNGFWNPDSANITANGSTVSAVGYDRIKVTAAGFPSAQVGTGDVTGDPGFVDRTRNLAAWSTHKGGAGTVSDAVSRCSADRTLIADLVSWVRAGFRPTNAAYHNAAHDGGDIGAMDYLALASSYTLTGPSSGTVGEESTDFTVTPVGGEFTGTITITPTGGGLSTPIVLTFAASSTPQTFTITPTEAGTVTLTPTDSGSLTDPAALEYEASSGGGGGGGVTSTRCIGIFL